MTIILSWNLIPIIITVLYLFVSISDIVTHQGGGYFDFGPIVWFITLPIPLLAWLIYFIIF
jgi:hypothetical protein